MQCIMNTVEAHVIPDFYKAFSILLIPYIFKLECKRTMFYPVLKLYLDWDQISPVTLQVKMEVLECKQVWG